MPETEGRLAVTVFSEGWKVLVDGMVFDDVWLTGIAVAVDVKLKNKFLSKFLIGTKIIFKEISLIQTR